jgi:hydrogenase expression/formation protein HypC
MCLAIPGKISSVVDGDGDTRQGTVDFGGIVKQVDLSLVPEAELGDYVLVHVGLAITRVDEVEAQRVFDYLREFEDLDELEESDL